MSKMVTTTDAYFLTGCGRCSRWNTPECSALIWQHPLDLLRKLVLDSGLEEELKWAHPCYTYQGKIVVMLGAFKGYALITFVKGVLMNDTEGILIQATENMQSDRQIRFTSLEEVVKQEHLLRDYLHQAIAIEKAGLKVAYKKTEDYAIPEELLQKFEEMPDFKTAFEALTQGRQRGYLLHFAAPKQAKTRHARIEKYIQHIFDGKGWNDYQNP